MPKTAVDLIEGLESGREEHYKGQLRREKLRVDALYDALKKAKALWGSTYKVPTRKNPKRTASKYYTLVAVGDLHGAHLNIAARDAFYNDLEALKPKVIVLLGDLLDCAGTYSRFKKQHLMEFSYSYADELRVVNDFLDTIQRICPDAEIYYIEGNHENRVEGWAVEKFDNKPDAQLALDMVGPKNTLHLDKRGIPYFELAKRHMGLETPGTIKLEKSLYLHGPRTGGGIHMTYNILRRLGDNLVHGHGHRIDEKILRNSGNIIGGWQGGCLCDIQPYYFHGDPTDHCNGFHVKFINSKTQWHDSCNIKIIDGKSTLSGVRGFLKFRDLGRAKPNPILD
jgi:predicted phosphodiesterase